MTIATIEHAPALDLTGQMEYARSVSTASMLPQAYRGKPADILLAVGLGQAMGLTPAESLYRISVIQGKPTADAELIAANVRKAGHILRLRVDEDNVVATCTIIRADDPDHEHTVTRDKAWAQQMGLLGKDNYKKQPATMLGWRAVTACARMACSEALYGVGHSTAEIADSRPAPTSTTEPQGNADRLRAHLAPTVDTPEPDSCPVLLDTKSALAKRLYTGITEAGMSKDDTPAFYSEVTGRDITSSKELTEAEASACIDALPAQGELMPENGPATDGRDA